MDKEAPTKAAGIGFTDALTLLFVGLKLTHRIDWSWWWVVSPTLVAIGILTIARVIHASNR